MMVNKIDRQDKIWIGRRFSDSLVDCVSLAAGTELLSSDISITTRIIIPSSFLIRNHAGPSPQASV